MKDKIQLWCRLPRAPKHLPGELLDPVMDPTLDQH